MSTDHQAVLWWLDKDVGAGSDRKTGKHMKFRQNSSENEFRISHKETRFFVIFVPLWRGGRGFHHVAVVRSDGTKFRTEKPVINNWSASESEVNKLRKLM